MKIDVSKRLLILEKQKEEQETDFMEFQTYYKHNKDYMPQKIKSIYKQISKAGICEAKLINLNFVSFQNNKYEYLSRIMPYFVGIHTLKLWKSNLGSHGMKILSKKISNLQLLECLSLEDNGLGSDGSMYLSLSLKKLTKLRELWLQVNNIGPAGASYIADALENLKYLERLGLDENDMGSNGTLRIVQVAAKLSHLKTLGLGYNMITEDACLNIAILLATSSLDKLSLSGNSISEMIHSRILTLLPRTLINF